MTSINEESALKEIKLLKLKHDDILVFHLHRAPIAEDAAIIDRTLRKIPQQVCVFLLGPKDSVDQFSDDQLSKYGLQRIPKAAA